LTGDIAIFDPRRLDEADFLAGFVARVDMFDFLLRQFRGLEANDVATHRLLIGQRGMGKTTLLRRLAIGVEQDTQLRQVFVPLTFREEQYNVRSLAQLWRNCAEALAGWLEHSGRAGDAGRIDRELAKSRLADPDAAFAQFVDFCRQVDRRPALFLDNLDLILGALPEAEGWKLRSILQARGGPFVIGASTAFLEQSVNPKAPFYEFFQVHMLEPLGVADMRTCLAGLARKRGDDGKRVLTMLGNAPERIPVLHTLTGGNPRTLAFIYRLIESGLSADAQRDLEQLLESVSGLYKARVEELPAQARAVFDAIALHWDPAPTALLVDVTMLEPTSLSPQINRLVERGYVERTERDDGKSGWQVAERFFNIWYLMRNGERRVRQRLRWLTAFLTNFYTRDELSGLGRGMAARALSSAGEARAAFALAEAADDPHLRRALTRRASLNLLAGEHGQIELIAAMADLDDVARAWDETIRRARAARAWSRERADAFVNTLRCSGRSREQQRNVVGRLEAMSEDAVEVLERALRDEAIRGWKESLPPEIVAAVERAIENRALADPLDYENAETAAAMVADVAEKGKLLLWDALSRRDHQFINRNRGKIEAAILLLSAKRSGKAALGLARLLEQLPDKSSDAVEAYREAIRLDPNESDLWRNLGTLLQVRLARYDEAETAYREAIRLNPSIAWHWQWLGDLLMNKLVRYDEAERAYREAIRLDPALTWAWNALGNLLQERFARYDEAEAAYREAIRLDPAFKWSWYGLATLMHLHLSRYDDAEVAYRRAIELDPSFWPFWYWLAILLHEHFARYDEVEKAYREAIRLDPTHAWLWFRLGKLLQNHLARYDEAEAAYLEAIRLDHPQSGPWHSLGRLLADHLGDPVRAREAFAKAEAFGKNQLATEGRLWLELAEGNLATARELREFLNDVTAGDRPDLETPALIDGAIALLGGDVALAFARLRQALHRDGGVPPANFDDFLRLLRLFAKHGAGEKLLDWLDETGLGDRVAPARAAFDAYLHGERKLLNVNPETRGVAERLYRWLTSNRRERDGPIWPGPGASALDAPKRPSGSRRKTTR
jgi:tetratricopeptide (TPR) repeat protein